MFPTICEESDDVTEMCTSHLKQKVRVAAVSSLVACSIGADAFAMWSRTGGMLLAETARETCIAWLNELMQVAGGEDSEGGRYNSTDEMWRTELGRAEPKSSEGWYGKGVKYWEVCARRD